MKAGVEVIWEEHYPLMPVYQRIEIFFDNETTIEYFRNFDFEEDFEYVMEFLDELEEVEEVVIGKSVEEYRKAANDAHLA